MRDADKTKEQLVEELEEMRQRIAELETGEAKREKAEEAIEGGRDFLEKLLNSMWDAVFFVKMPERTIEWANDSFKLTGYEPEDCVGRTTEFLYPDKSEFLDFGNKIKRAIAAGKDVLHAEQLLKRKNGEVFPSEITTTLFREEGEVVRVTSIVRDITERKQIENQLKESEERYRDLFEDAPNAYFLVGTDGHIKMANKRAVELLGYTMDELIGRSVFDLYADTPTGKAQAEKVFKRFRAGEEIRGEELEMRSADGKQVWINLSVKPVKDAEGQVIASRSIVVDVTQRRYMQQALAEERRRLAATLRSTGDGVITTDTDEKVVLVNRVAETLTGWTQKEAAGKPLNEVFNVIDEKSRAPITNPVGTVLKTGRIIGLTNHAVLVARDGTERLIADSGAPIHDEHGQLLGVVLVFRDITELRKLEEELVRAAKLESVGTLAGGIAHDFNNLLTGIMGNISLAKRYVEPGEKAFDRLEEAEKASLRARDLTQQLLTFATGGAPITKTVSIAELIEDSATFALSGSDIRCEFSLPDNLWPVEADEGQINQVIASLVINAREAMPGGGILRIGAKNTSIRRGGALPLPAGKYVEITIEDQGIGILKEHLERIFEPYFTTKQQGSGLGITTAYSIIKKHDGHITVRSTPTVGTTFYIYLPASEKPIPTKKEVVAETRAIGKGRILVMDDEEIIRQLLDTELSDAGYEVELTADGAQAIERYTKAKESGQPFDAVILDLTVPGGMGGKETIRNLLEIDPGVKAIVSSGYSTDPIMSDFKDYGFSGVITKPYNLEQMEKMLFSIIGKNG